MRRGSSCVVALVVILFGSRAARAANSSVYEAANVTGTIFQYPVTQGPGETLTFATSGLSSGSDTVIHVQNADDPQNTFVAGNDDYSGVASQVTVPAIGSYRHLLVLVRAYATAYAGTCTLTTTSSDWGSWNTSATFGGTATWLGGGLTAGAHISTAEWQLNTSDTVLLLLSSTEHAVAFDDDDGVGFMSFIHNPEAIADAQVILANKTDTGNSVARLVWDDDADTTDYDCDGLGATLEAYLGTNSTNVFSGCADPDDTIGTDSDQDGINDGDELLGKDASPPLKFPAWGARPLTKDLFIEVDWQACPGCSGGLDEYRLSAADVAQIKADFLPVRVHVDIGVSNTNVLTYEDWGDWGGAERRTDSNPGWCQGLTPSRANSFHYGLSLPGGGSAGFGYCMFISPNGYVISHEAGHNMALYHSGRPLAGNANAKPNYVSRMNYEFQNDAPSFSHGDAPVQVLNPAYLDEQKGLCTTDPYILSKITNAWCRGATCVKDQGLTCPGNVPTIAIDWNRDGHYETAGGPLVRGAPTNQWGIVGNNYARTEFDTDVLSDSAMTWVTVGGTLGDLLVIAGRGPSGELQWTKQTRSLLNGGCSSFSLPFFDSLNCAGFAGSATNWPSGKTSETAPGVAELNGTVMFVSQPCCAPSTSLRSNILTINNSTGQPTYGSDVTLPGTTVGSTVVASGDVTALSTGAGVVMAWAPDSSSPVRLKQWTYSSGAWSLANDERWEDAANGHPLINPMYGIGVTIGYQEDVSGASVYAAIPDAANGGLVQFARRSASTGRWTKISAWTGTGTLGVQPSVRARPGLAFQPFSSTEGRFYMALNLPASCAFSPDPSQSFGGGCESKIIMTEGNRTLSSPTERRLLWIAPSYSYSINLEPALGGVSLMYDPVRDTNLRGLRSFSTGPSTKRTTFFPMADGIINVALTDMDDYQYLQGALRASLGLEELPLP